MRILGAPSCAGVVVAVVISCLAGPAGAEAPRVVASVKPVHSLVASVMKGVEAPRLLVDGAQSPHTYDLDPSEALAIENADLVVWVGPTLETFLTRPVRSLGRSEASLRLQDVEGVRLLKTRIGGAWEAHAHDHGGHGSNGGTHGDDPAHDDEPADAHHGHADHGHEDKHHDAHGREGDGQGEAIPEDRIDPHIWLDPDNARAIVSALAERLSKLDPAHAETYRTNAKATRADLVALKQELKARLAPVRTVPYVVFHDAYHYFESAFDVRPVGAITLSPDRKPGARRLFEIRNEIEEREARCVFREPQFAPKLVDTVLEGTDARAGMLDPLGADLPKGPDAYFTLLSNLADNLVDCLGEES